MNPLVQLFLGHMSVWAESRNEPGAVGLAGQLQIAGSISLMTAKRE